MKSCENCYHKQVDGESLLCNNVNNCNDHNRWKPDYPTLERENTDLNQSLERACECIAEAADANGDCNICPIDYKHCPFRAGESSCVEALKKYFKETPQ